MSGDNNPIGYRIEYRTGRYCFYTLEDFRRETQRYGGRIHSLHAAPFPGCSSEPVAYLGSYWTEAENRRANAYLDKDAAPIFLGPEVHDPESDHV